ncbi:unnamed protein product [Anisakis simplex]|uniref:protein-tyrosine-phosphatase n=1 Tax=Anisakis simplex TaxID=6269 RepID=A0A0M3KH39_ANISI|nr:unnamed protein product [Anisakis simplex]
MRVQSTSYIESGKCARDKLPDLLHVEYSLRTLSRPQIDSVAFKSIDGSTLVELMESLEISEFEKKFIIVDCRYPYEYNGGHIRGAINLHDPSNLQSVFYPNSIPKFQAMLRRIPIFYCEYSQERGPSMASALRQYDRCRNESRYPEVDYKEIYVLDRGYRKFFRQDGFVRFCEPQTYVTMREPSYHEELKRYRFHKTKSFGGLSSSYRMSNLNVDATNVPRRTRLTFRSISEDTTSTMTPLRSSLKNSTDINLTSRCPDLFGSPFPCPSAAITPPKSDAGPIKMPHFS